jgi:hypothetical protein
MKNFRNITLPKSVRRTAQWSSHANPESAKWDAVAQITRHTPYSHGWLHVPA